MPTRIETVGTLLATEAGKVSKDNEIDGAGGKVDGKFVDGKEMELNLELPEGSSLWHSLCIIVCPEALSRAPFIFLFFN